MTHYADSVLVMLVMIDLFILATSRLGTCIRGSALQGLTLALFPIVLATDGAVLVTHVAVISIGTLLLKAIVIPWLLLRALRKTEVRREVEPFVSQHISILLGAVLVGVAFWASAQLPLPRPVTPRLLVPVALATLLIGFLIIVSRKKAITQVVGYLMMENGIFVFGMSLAHEMPFVDATHDPQAAPHLFVPCLLWFLAAMTLVTVSQHLAVMWAGVEATTLASAPLIYFYRRRSALEATWKYLLICSVGIALALLGTFFLGTASASLGDGAPSLVLGELQSAAPHMTGPWMKVAFIMALLGYGTKMGLVPMHTWLPDAHSQAPSPVSALLSGALLNCAFLGVLRFYQVALATGDAAFARTLLVVFGFVSIGVAAAFMVGQRDYKRLFAYSSVENMGVLAVGVGLGGAATFGAMLHAVNHSLCKAALFLLAGNVLRAYGTTTAGEVRGVLRQLPVSGVLLTACFLAIGGAPPFGPFMSELVIFQSAVQGSHLWLGVLFIALLAVGFLGMAGVLLPMLQGQRPSSMPRSTEGVLSVITPLCLCAAVLVLGVYLPAPLSDVLHRTAALFGGAP